jgi:hypothetical protein
MKYCKCERCGVKMETKTHNKKYCETCRLEKLKEQNAKYGKLNYEKKQLDKKNNHKCIICGELIINKQLSAKYCDKCKKTIVKNWRNESYKRNINTVKTYCFINKNKIRDKRRIFEQKNRDNISNRYIKKILREKNGWVGINIPQSIIDLKTIIIKTKRLCKQSQN